jgi:hypothetical protein
MEDDPREVNWAPNQIKALRTAVNELQSAVASIRSQQGFMLGEGHGEPFEVWCRRQLSKMAIGLRDLSDQGNSDRDRLNQVIGQVSALESPVFTGPTAARLFTDNASMPTGTAVAGMENYMVDVEFSAEPSKRKLIGPAYAHHDAPCTEACYEKEHISEGDDGPRSTDSALPSFEDIENRRRTLVEAMKEKRVTFRPGLADETPLIQAEVRVRDYMGNHFSTATVEGVVAALRGGVVRPEDNYSDAPLPRKVKTVECPADSNRGPDSCWAWGRIHYHDKVGVVHLTDPGKG